MKVKTSELTGAALDWAVARCEGVRLEHGLTDDERYSTEWAQGGPIVEREKMGVEYVRYAPTPNWMAGNPWLASWMRTDGWRVVCVGPTALVAAMRCYVASRLGDEVEIPEELMA